MSTAVETQPTGQDAEALLMREVFAPAFFDKMAANGVSITTEEEAVEYLAIGRKLLAADGHEKVKSAGTRLDFLKEANARLDNVLKTQYGVAVSGSPEDVYIKNAETVLGAHPAVQTAVEVYLAALQRAA